MAEKRDADSGTELWEVLRQQARTRGERPFVLADDRRRTFGEVEEDARALAAALHHLGVEPGDRVAVDLPNWPEFVVALLAAARLGCVVVPLNPEYTARELGFMLRNSEAVVVVAAERFGDTDYLQLFESFLFELPDLQYLATVGEEDLWYDDRIFQFEDLVSSGRGRDLPRPEVDPTGDTFALLYTPGTTGKPKGVMLSQANLVRTARATADALSLGPDDVTLCSVPLFHIFGLGAALTTALVSGGRLVLQPSFDARAALELVERHGVTVFHGVPTMFFMALRALDEEEEGREGEREDGDGAAGAGGTGAAPDLSTLRTGIVAGAPASPELVRRVRERLVPELEIAYGLTETSPTVAITRPDDPPEKREATVGRPLEGVEVRLLDEEGEAVGPGEVGELTVRGFNVMQGYLRQPDETASSFVGDGYFRTGDLAAVDAEGYLRVVGRKSGVIIRGGFNVHPREVEDHLRSHPAVLEVVVVGVPNEVLGELVCACVRAVEGAIITEEELKAYCREDLTDYKVPDEVVFFEAFPETPEGRVLRAEVARRAREQVEGA